MKYKLQKSIQQQGWWIVTDTENQISVKFKEHEFNETQDVVCFDKDILKKGVTAKDLARYMRELGDWVAMHHYNIAMQPVAFCVQYTEDDKHMVIERGKYPRFRVIINDDCDPNRLGSALKKAGEFIIKKGMRK